MIKGGEDFFKDKNDDYSSGRGRSPLRDFPSDRVSMIEKIFQEVLGRKPSSRELSYYKYGAMSEDDIRIKLLTSDEHKKALEDASKLSGVEVQLKNVQLNEKKLNQKIEDLENQIAEVHILLSEKNSIISELREQVENPYNLNKSRERYEEGFDVYNAHKVVSQEIPKQKSFRELLKEFFNILLK